MERYNQGEGYEAAGRRPAAVVSDWVKALAAALLAALLVYQFLFHLAAVRGYSMQPTFDNGDWLLVNRAVYWLGSPQAGEIVILYDPQPEEGDERASYLVKRIIAAPGDTVELRHGAVYVNGIAKEERYVHVLTGKGQFGPAEVPDGHYFIMGDNRQPGASRDSRSFGFVSSDAIVGRAEWVVWPWKN